MMASLHLLYRDGYSICRHEKPDAVPAAALAPPADLLVALFILGACKMHRAGAPLDGRHLVVYDH